MKDGSKKTDIVKMTFDFSVRIIKLYRYFTEKSPVKERNICNQLERSATSIGANINEAQYAQSKADFLTKATIALKESNETIYWIKLLNAGDYITNDQANSLLDDAESIKRVLACIVKTSKEKQ